MSNEMAWHFLLRNGTGVDLILYGRIIYSDRN